MDKKTKQFLIVGIVVAIVIAILAPFLASGNPDGLESAAEKIITPGVSEGGVYEAPLPDYIVPSLGEEPISGSIAIVLGVIIVFGLAYGLGHFLKKRNHN